METAEPPAYKLYSAGQIALAAFLGSPLAACWFWSRNYHRLGDTRNSKLCIIWGTVGTAAMFTAAYFLPDQFPNFAIPIGYTFGMLQAAKQTHGITISNHLANGGRLGSWWAVAGISLLFVVAIVAIAIVVALLLPGET